MLIREESPEQIQQQSLSSLLITALVNDLPLPDRLFIPVTGCDDVARKEIDGWADSLRLHGIMFRLIDDEARFGLEIRTGSAVARWIHVRDHVVNRAAVTP